MPRNVRNFWIECDIDGRENVLAGGPKAKDGGFTLTVKMRDEGGISTPLRIDGYARTDGKLVLLVSNDAKKQTVVHGEYSFRIETRR